MIIGFRISQSSGSQVASERYFDKARNRLEIIIDDKTRENFGIIRLKIKQEIEFYRVYKTLRESIMLKGKFCKFSHVTNDAV